MVVGPRTPQPRFGRDGRGLYQPGQERWSDDRVATKDEQILDRTLKHLPDSDIGALGSAEIAVRVEEHDPGKLCSDPIARPIRRHEINHQRVCRLIVEPLDRCQTLYRAVL